MAILPSEFQSQISTFKSLFSNKVFNHSLLLLTGLVLCRGKRTVSTALRVMGLEEETRFHKYHRVLSRSRWSSLKGAGKLLHLLVGRFAQQQQVLVFGIDETLERRKGKRIQARGIYRDSVRSSGSHFTKSSGLRWISLMLLTPISWADRVWALPFFTVLAPSSRFHEQKGKQHKKISTWARQMLFQLSRWLPNRKLVVVGDSAYACLELLNAVSPYATFVTRLRLDAALYAPAPARQPGKAGRPALKGKRLDKLKDLLEKQGVRWSEVLIPAWYSSTNKQMLVASGTAIWYHCGKPTVPIRWVLLKDPEGKLEPAALLCTDQQAQPLDIINFFIRRWTVEVTFQQAREHLGIQTQRQWSDLAIARTTPVLMASFSIVTLWADQLKQQNKLNIQATAWYKKTKPTFSDAIYAVRQRIWEVQDFSTSTYEPDRLFISRGFFKRLMKSLARAT